MHEINNRLINLLRYIGYSLNSDAESQQDKTENEELDVNEIIQKLEAEKRATLDLIRDSELKVDAAITGLIDKLSIYPFIKTAQNIRTYLKQKKSDQGGKSWKRWLKQGGDYLQKTLC